MTISTAIVEDDPDVRQSLSLLIKGTPGYALCGAYGSAEIDVQPLPVTGASVSADRHRVRLRTEGLRALYVHELRAAGVRSAAGAALAHPDAYYTLNRIPVGR